MTDVGYSWFIGKLTEDPRTTETITITYPNYLLLLAEMRDDIASLENIAMALEAIAASRRLFSMVRKLLRITGQTCLILRGNQTLFVF